MLLSVTILIERSHSDEHSYSELYSLRIIGSDCRIPRLDAPFGVGNARIRPSNLTQAKEFKDSGAALFAEKKYADAITAYCKAIELIEDHPDPDSTSSPIWYSLY
jgi:hypothetical protein